MVVPLTYKNEEDSIKNEGARVLTRFSPVLGRIKPNFELVRDIMVVLITCKNEEDSIKNEGARVLTRFSPL